MVLEQNISLHDLHDIATKQPGWRAESFGSFYRFTTPRGVKVTARRNQGVTAELLANLTEHGLGLTTRS